MKRGGDVMEYQNFSLIKEDIQADAWGNGDSQKPAQEISLKKQSI